MKRIPLLTALLMMSVLAGPALGDPKVSEVEVECGDIVEGEFVVAVERHEYKIKMAPGDVLDAFVAPVGDFLEFRARVLEPAGNEIFKEPAWNTGTVKAPVIKTGVLSGKGEYRIQIQNHDAYERPGNLGIYTLHIGCKLRNSREIKPGEVSKVASESMPSSSDSNHQTSAAPRSTGVDLPKISFPKFSLNGPVEGTLSKDGNQVFGFRFGAVQGDEIRLIYSRKSGNLALEVFVLDQQETVLLQVRMADAKDFASHIVLPKTGDYTVAVRRTESAQLTPVDTTFMVEIQKTAHSKN